MITVARNAPAAAPSSASGYTVVDLGAGFNPTSINDAGLVVGYRYDDDGKSHPYVWRDGTLSALPSPAALPGYTLDGTYGVPRLDAAGDIAESFVDETNNSSVDVPYVWHVGTDGGYTTPVQVEDVAGTGNGVLVTGMNSLGDLIMVKDPLNVCQCTQVTGPLGSDIQDVPDSHLPGGIGNTTFVFAGAAPAYPDKSNPYQIGSLADPTATGTPLGFAPVAESGAGWILGQTLSSDHSSVLRSPGGDLTTVAANVLGFVNDSGNALGQSAWQPRGAADSTPLIDLFPPGTDFTSSASFPARAFGLNNHNDIIGVAAIDNDPNNEHGFLLKAGANPPPVVNSTGDAEAVDSGSKGCDTGQTVTLNGSSVPECTLRAAIQAENAGSVQQQVITFTLPASNAITLVSELPALKADGVTIDGTTASAGSVSIDGTALPTNAAVLHVSGGSDVLQGLTPENAAIGVLVDGKAGHDVVRACSIGVLPGSVTGTGLTTGVEVSGSPSVTIGGPATADGNVMSRLQRGLFITGAGSSQATVQSNYFGTDAAGDDIPDVEGIQVRDASGAHIGGAASSPGAAPGNVFDGLTTGAATEEGSAAITIVGVSATVSSTTVQGNVIGLQPDGSTVGSSHFRWGVLAGGRLTGTVIGGAASGAGNVIAATSVAGVTVTGTSVSGTQILGNLIGTDASGTHVHGNVTGVAVDGASTTTVGTSGAGRNVIAGGQYGISTSATSSPLQPDGANSPAAPGTNHVTTKSAMSTVISGNIVGPLADGTTVDADSVLTDGVVLAGIGETLGPNNEIAFTKTAVNVANNSETVTGNQIGTTPSGSNSLPNGVGVFVAAGAGVGSMLKNHVPTVRIGVPGQKPNLISGNTVNLYLPSPASVQGNLIGTTSDGKAAIGAYTGGVPVPDDITHGPGFAGVQVLSSGEGAMIGGTQPGMANVISGGPTASGSVQATGALAITGKHTTVQGNDIGVGNDGATAVPNAGYGINVAGGSDDVIGAPAPGGKGTVTAAGGNVVAYNGGGGIIIGKNVSGVQLLSNLVHDNTPDGVRLTDETSNAGLTAPTITAATQDAKNTGAKDDTTVVTGKSTLPGATVQIYAATNCPNDQSPGQGGSVLATGMTDAHGNFTMAVPVQPVGTQLDATLTFTTNSSGFSGCTPVAPAANGNVTKPTDKPATPDTAHGSDFTPGEPVQGTLHSAPVSLGTQTADADGRVSFTFDIPAGIDPGQHYVVLTGGTSGRSTAIPLTVYTVASAPRQLSARGGKHEVTLSWAAPTTNNGSKVTGYRIQRSGNGRSYTALHTTTRRSFIDRGVAGGHRYYYRVQAINAAGASPASPTSSALPYATPTAPRSLHVTAHHAALTLRWAAPAHNNGAAISSYVVQYATCTIGAKGCAVHSRTVHRRSLTLKHLSSGHRYHVRVIAINRAGRGAPSQQATGLPKH